MALETALREVCVLLFREPHRVVQFMCHSRRKLPWSNPLHHHDDIVQFDFCEGFEGMLQQAERRIICNGNMAFIHYPGVRHRYHLVPSRAHASIFSLKLRLSPDLELVRERCLPAVMRNLMECRELREALIRLGRARMMSRGGTVMRMAIVAEVLSLWPVRRGKETMQVAALDEKAYSLDMIERAVAFIEDSNARPVSVKEVAGHVGISKRQLTRRLYATMGIGVHELIEQRRLIVAREMAADLSRKITEIADNLGFSSLHAFSRWFKRLTGQSPSRYREKSGEL